ncbi:MAG: hypothetical protein EAZ35_06190 [Sphingobacteriia bacterium]|nr:MAG: hypothetical protein EAZ41_08440 [Sphingobacteriia bacterium]TAG30785.1 MAG: hypothetical protein EAZ35_06190 [Sphingobacteriia bacterium]
MLTIGCNKQKLPDFYYKCKIDGQEYKPNNCANCLTCTIYRDTIFLLGANRGYESVNIGINDRSAISVKNYILNNIIGKQAGYDNSSLVNDIYKTDSTYTGTLNIIALDRVNKIIEGNFSFTAYNLVQQKKVVVSDGKFRLKYTTN